MQDDLLSGYPEIGWDVVEVRYEKHYNYQNKMFETFITYVHTIPRNWLGPESGEDLPWLEDLSA